MTEAQLQETIFTIIRQIAPEADLSALSLDDDIRDALSIDSFDHLNILIGLNDAVGVDIPEADAGQLTTVETIIRYLATRVD
ncbi:MAG: phosphopantetheine-binding protein [Candidatus Entotheonella factor]|uniref:Phosphopantetheine-binding protein n=1 Tax=Entotheonella factor TaxID=1429438 RepID=W4LAC4_ENTF1|nr:phosphopantetheine-binding protein [Candidatus Entotheonella palauensis]ETW95048.1 MAG: phosphopantetheine-binding protein [Candidatus Entotheonella factor]